MPISMYVPPSLPDETSPSAPSPPSSTSPPLIYRNINRGGLNNNSNNQTAVLYQSLSDLTAEEADLEAEETARINNMIDNFRGSSTSTAFSTFLFASYSLVLIFLFLYQIDTVKQLEREHHKHHYNLDVDANSNSDDNHPAGWSLSSTLNFVSSFTSPGSSSLAPRSSSVSLSASARSFVLQSLSSSPSSPASSSVSSNDHISQPVHEHVVTAGTIIILIVLLGLAYDNMVIAMGHTFHRINRRHSLSLLSQGRYVLHAIATPMLFVSTVELGHIAGVEWCNTPAYYISWLIAVAFAAITTFVHFHEPSLAIKPFSETQGLLVYGLKNDTALTKATLIVPSLLLCFFSIVVGSGIWFHTGHTMLCFASVVMFICASAPPALRMVLSNFGEVVFMLGFVLAERGLREHDSSHPSQ